MRRLTWVRYNHFVATCRAGWMIGRPLKYFQSRIGFVRGPMQRTEYYMPWGVVTVDELCRMDGYISERQPEGARWWLDDEGNERS